jgi:hypothetical protein
MVAAPMKVRAAFDCETLRSVPFNHWRTSAPATETATHVESVMAKHIKRLLMKTSSEMN